MQIKIKNLLTVVTFVVLSSNLLFSQINTSSPYSRFGIGDIENQTLGRSPAMGGASVGLRLPFEINIINPASYSALPVQTFLLQAGIKVKRTNFIYENSTFKNDNYGISSLNAAYNVNKYWGMSFGLTPVSSVGYEIYTEDSVKTDNADYTSKFETNYVGEGGLNQLYLGNAFSYKGISVGFNAAYVFGRINRRTESNLNDDYYNSVLLDTRDINVSDFYFKYGMQYHIDSIRGEFNSFTAGFFYENKAKLDADVTRFARSVVIINGNQLTDTVMNDTIFSGSVGLPSAFGVGFSFTTKQFLVAFDYINKNWKDTEVADEDNTNITNSSNIALGIEFTPNFMSKNFFKAMNYRVGGHYSNTYLKLNNEQIKDMGISFGFGIPVKKSRTKINIGFEIGKRGTNKSGLIQENYYTINMNFNMADMWFIKRKFN